MSNSIKKRETFYLAGYDPRGTRHYYNLYKKEAPLSSKINGMTFTLSPRKKETAHIKSCTIEAQSIQNEQRLHTRTNYYFLEWDDIIRTTWNPSIFIFIMQFIHYLKAYMVSTFIFKIYRLYLRQLKPLLYPIFYLFVTFLIALMIVQGINALLSLYLSTFVSLGIASVLAVLFVRFSILLGRKLAVFWILRIYIFSESYAHTERKDIEKRLKHFASYIVKRVNRMETEEIDEMLIVSHSVGTILMIPLLAEMLKSLKQEDLDKISVVSLGGCVPLVSFLDDVETYKKDMETLTQYEFSWLDISSPSDEICCPLLDYYDYSGIDKKSDRGPHFISPRFHTLYERSHYEKLQKDLSLMHFLYLMAPQKEGAYDYFKLTAGHETYVRNLLKETR
ncbi:MAG: hypothetical protein U9O64_06135 [Campylobacterota bacterium]|nr:hypothetical protein [Campylobacterota bacterium]